MSRSTAAGTSAAEAAMLSPSAERRAVTALAAAAFALSLNTNVLAAVLPFVGADIELDEDRRALLVSAAGFGSAIGALTAVSLCRRMGTRAALVASLHAFVVISAVHPLAGAFWPLLVLRALSSIAVGVAYAAASAAVAELTPYGRRGAVMGRFNAGMFLAIPVGLPLAVLLATTVHWSGIFVVQAGVGVLAVVLTRRFVPIGPGPRAASASWSSVLRVRGVAATLVATMLHVGSFFTVVQLAGAWLDESGLVPKEQQLFVWMALGAVSVLGSGLVARFSDRVGKRAFVLQISVPLVGCFALLALGPGPLGLLGLGGLLAVCAAARTGPLQALLSGLVPGPDLPALMGLRGFCMQLGVGLFSLGSAPLGAQFGFRGVLVLGAVCQAVSFVAILLGVRERSPNGGDGPASPG